MSIEIICIKKNNITRGAPPENNLFDPVMHFMKLFHKMIKKIFRFFFNEEDVSSAHWRTELLNWMLRGTALLATFAVITGGFSQIQDGRIDLASFFLCAYIIVIILTFSTGLNYNLRAVTLTATYYMIAVSEFVSAGVTGDGNLFMLNFIVLSLVLFNIRTGLFNYAVSIITLVAIAYLFITRQLSLPENMGTQSFTAVNWITAIIGYIFMTAVPFISVNYLINRLGLRDKLTSVYNRHDFHEILMQEIKKSERLGYKLSLLLLDIDNFKFINDNFSHATGDAVLRDFAELLRGTVRETDKIFRWGGEEFLIISGNTSEEKIMAFGKKLCKTIEKQKFTDVGTITASIGISIYRRIDTFDEFINRADEALHKAKIDGKNRVRIS